MLAGIRRKPEPASVSDYDKAKMRWTEVSSARNAVAHNIRRRHLAQSIAFYNEASQDRTARVREIAGADYIRLATRRPEEFARETRELEFQFEESAAAFAAEVDAWNSARRTESNRIARELQPSHRNAVKEIAAALESLSRAIGSERAVRAEFARLAPEPVSALLPGMSPTIGTLGEWASQPAQWSRSARKNGYLQ
ncbi:MAG: hypothetical protein WA210_18140 [Burkholderiaceae bacterium]